MIYESRDGWKSHFFSTKKQPSNQGVYAKVMLSSTREKTKQSRAVCKCHAFFYKEKTMQSRGGCKSHASCTPKQARKVKDTAIKIWFKLLF
jgi:hypothetical protein